MFVVDGRFARPGALGRAGLGDVDDELLLLVGWETIVVQGPGAPSGGGGLRLDAERKWWRWFPCKAGHVMDWLSVV